MITRTFTVGDRAVPLKAKLYRPGGTPVVLGPNDEVSFRMVSLAGVVKVDNGQVTILDLGSAEDRHPAEVEYQWQMFDVDTPGTFVAWFIRESADGKPEHFPVQDPDAPELQIVFKADS